jgi:hypothetical protein
MITTIPKWTSALLRETNPSVHAMVFANHDGKKALRQVLEFLDANRDGMSTANEKERASIIIYGHSWGASQTVALARALGEQRIPVLLDNPNRQRSQTRAR